LKLGPVFWIEAGVLYFNSPGNRPNTVSSARRLDVCYRAQVVKRVLHSYQPGQVINSHMVQIFSVALTLDSPVILQHPVKTSQGARCDTGPVKCCFKV
jgi:hypothetical protein